MTKSRFAHTQVDHSFPRDRNEKLNELQHNSQTRKGTMEDSKNNEWRQESLGLNGLENACIYQSADKESNAAKGQW